MSMRSWFLASVLLSMPCAAPTVFAAETQTPHGGYAIVARIPGPDGMWDYAMVSSDAHRLYLAQGERISMLDLDRAAGDAWTHLEVARAMWHGVVPVEARGLLLGANGQAHALTLFDVNTRELVNAVSTGTGPKSALSGKMAEFAVLADPDAIVVEPKSGLAAAVNGGSGEVALVDLDKKAVVGRVFVGGKLEFAVADGTGRLYVNVQTAHEIAVIDVLALKVVRRIPLSGCLEPKGLAYDPGTDLLISGCDNGTAKFVLAKTGRVIASRRIGRGADAVIVDERRHRAFVPSGADAILSIFDIEDTRHISLLQTLPTEKGTRLGAVDIRTGRLYLPAATLGPPIPPHPWPSAVPGTFHVLVVDSAGGP
jgi:DNA-binding beta-propeller fold protein YncE